MKNINMEQHINHSGGASGSDLYWEIIGETYGVSTRAYSFEGHSTLSNNRVILTDDELNVGWVNILKADDVLKRGTTINTPPYVSKLLSRNWYQVDNSDTILAIGEFRNTKKTQVRGGTGWAVQMAISNNKNIYVFDQISDMWYIYWKQRGSFVPYYEIPKLTYNFAGIGTRGLGQPGKTAIEKLYEYNFKK